MICLKHASPQLYLEEIDSFVSQIKGRQEREKAGRKMERRKKGRKEEEREGGKRGFRGDIWERRAAFIFEE